VIMTSIEPPKGDAIAYLSSAGSRTAPSSILLGVNRGTAPDHDTEFTLWQTRLTAPVTIAQKRERRRNAD